MRWPYPPADFRVRPVISPPSQETAKDGRFTAAKDPDRGLAVPGGGLGLSVAVDCSLEPEPAGRYHVDLFGPGDGVVPAASSRQVNSPQHSSPEILS